MPMKIDRDADGSALMATHSFSDDEIMALGELVAAQRSMSQLPSGSCEIFEYQDNEARVKIARGQSLHRAIDAAAYLQPPRARASKMALLTSIGWTVAVGIAVAWWLSR